MGDIIINDNTESVTCRICGEQCKRIYGRHLKHSHNNMTTQEYKDQFPNAPITSLKDKKTTSKNSGLHMKQDKYKKMFSEKMKGDKNPMHRSNTTDEFRKQQSPFSVHFYKKRFPNMSDIEINEKISELANSFTEDRLLPSNKEYWIERGFSEEESIIKVSESQTTFSKEICIEKHGKIKGLQIWQDRQDKWLKTLDDKTDEEKREINFKKIKNSAFYSKISQELFWSIHDKVELHDKVMFTENDREYVIYDNQTKMHYMYDYVDRLNKKCIEFNGWFWHCKPSLYESTYYHKIKKKTAQQLWDFDSYKHGLIINEGYDLLVIWEDDYKKDKEGTVQKCIDFLLK